jgi:hypothetical protein
MSRVESIESQIRELSSDEFRALRDWLLTYDAESWDRQFEADANAGKLDEFANQALRDHSAGLSTKL